VASNAFVLGGGGLLGVAEAGSARALLDQGVVPDMIFGTSIGAINGAALAADPTPDGAATLQDTWAELAVHNVLGGSPFARIAQLVRSGTALHGNGELRRLLRGRLPVRTFDELTVPFECVAANIERASEHWFDSGDLVDAVLASCALPGVFPPVQVDGAHFVDGGLVNSIPLERAVRRGADTIWVLHVGRIEEMLAVPRNPWEVGFVAFEIARRHRFHTDLARVPDGVRVHVLPTGQPPRRRATTWTNLRYRDWRRIGDRARLAYEATLAYLAALP
jgi:NTE family protein